MKNNSLDKIKNLITGGSSINVEVQQIDEINRSNDNERRKNDEGEHVDWEQVGQVLKDSEFRDTDGYPDEYIDGDVDCASTDNCPAARAQLINGLMNHQSGNTFNMNPMLVPDALPPGVTSGQQSQMIRAYNACQDGVCPDYIKQELKDKKGQSGEANPNDPELPKRKSRPRGPLDLDDDPIDLDDDFNGTRNE